MKVKQLDPVIMNIDSQGEPTLHHHRVKVYILQTRVNSALRSNQDINTPTYHKVYGNVVDSTQIPCPHRRLKSIECGKNTEDTHIIVNLTMSGA